MSRGQSYIDMKSSKKGIPGPYQVSISIILSTDLEEFLTLKCEGFATCDPIRRWGGWSSRFPKLNSRS
ncbi:hypothetical protein PILCRDRAFT_819393 [Piloderma croceum F 1598]|uniref:Uncharacterized protein n=1 Tax=Piloderma croceum (strain F 1598) TaxID=765440 RepID=A0A0C3FUT4_PILCF|nr:hypothetical protein PILCRDRAFT_819393 [Piloderma croceum F 1598]